MIRFTLEISLSAETLAVVTRLASVFETIVSSSSLAGGISAPAQPAAPGDSAPADEVSPPEPAEGPGCAAGETCTGRRSTVSRAFSWGGMTAPRVARLRELWPTPMPISEIRAELEKIEGPPLGANGAIRQIARNNGLRRPATLLPKNFPQYRDVSKDVLSDAADSPIVVPPDVVAPIEPASPIIAAPLGDAAPTDLAGAPPPPTSRLETIRRVAESLRSRSIPASASVKAPPIEAGQEAIRHWAAQRGLTMDAFDLAAVNKRAASIGHPGFVLKQPPGHRQR